MERVGLTVDVAPAAGMFVWVDCGMDTNLLAERLLLAPGSLFSPSQLPSTRMRLNVAALQDPAIWQFLNAKSAPRAPCNCLCNPNIIQIRSTVSYEE